MLDRKCNGANRDGSKSCDGDAAINPLGTCDGFCAHWGLQCEKAWKDGAGHACAKEREIDCDDDDGGTTKDHICRCASFDGHTEMCKTHMCSSKYGDDCCSDEAGLEPQTCKDGWYPKRVEVVDGWCRAAGVAAGVPVRQYICCTGGRGGDAAGAIIGGLFGFFFVCVLVSFAIHAKEKEPRTLGKSILCKIFCPECAIIAHQGCAVPGDHCGAIFLGCWPVQILQREPCFRF